MNKLRFSKIMREKFKSKREIYSAEAETRNKAFMEEAVRKKSYGGHSVDNGENIVQFERSFSWFMVRL